MYTKLSASLCSQTINDKYGLLYEIGLFSVFQSDVTMRSLAIYTAHGKDYILLCIKRNV